MKSYTAKTLEELLQTVAKQKGVEVSDLTHFVTEEKSGFLGFGASVTADVYAYDDVENFIKGYLENFFNNLDLDVDVTVNYENNNYYVDLNADNNAILIGKNGQSLQGLNFLTRAAVNAHYKNRFYLMIDINGYKQDRYAKVKSMARRIAKSVQRSRISATLDPMPNDERKAVHQALTDFEHIKTESEGEGPYRKVIIKYVK